MTCRPSGRPSRRARATTRSPVRAPGRGLDRGRRGRGHRDRPHRAGLRRRGLPARQGARPAGHRADRRVGIVSTGSARCRGATSATSPTRSSSTSSAKAASTGSRRSSHRYPHCWRCNTPLVFRLVDEWYISMGPLYDQPRETLTAEQVDASLRYQIMDVVDRIRWIPDFGYERELDWLRNMHDWMISKKRYWGLALPIYDCAACGTIEVIGGREELKERAVEGWERSRATPRTDRTSTPSRSPARAAARRSSASRTSAIRGSTPGSCPFSTLHFREEPEYWRQWFPADFITESFPGQFRNWFYSMLAMSTVLRREEPFKTIFGYALLFAEDGRPDAQELGQRDRFRRGRRPDGRRRHALDVHQGTARGQHPLRMARGGRSPARAARPVERVLVLRHVRPARGLDARARQAPRGRRTGRSSIAGSCRGRPGPRPRWRTGCRTSMPVGATRALSSYLDGLSTWYLRLSRRRFSRSSDSADRGAAFATLHEALTATARMLAPDPAVPRRVAVPEPRRVRAARRARQRPPDALAERRTWPATATRTSKRRWPAPKAPWISPGRCAARPASRPASRSPRLWIALPGPRPADRRRPARAHRATRSTSRPST